MASEKLQQLLNSGEFDWDNVYHRQQFMKEWVAGEVKITENEDDPDVLSSSLQRVYE